MENEEQKKATQAYIAELIKAGKVKLTSLGDVQKDSDSTAKFVHNLEPRKSGRKRPRNYSKKGRM